VHSEIHAVWQNPIQTLENCKNCSSKCAYDCAQLNYDIQYDTEQFWQSPLLPPSKHHSSDEIIVHLANLSFVEGKFPTAFKQASVTPLIKGQSLDKLVPSNYRPISNLNFILKILERLFLSWFQSHILTSPNFNTNQSAIDPVAQLRPPYNCFSATSTAWLMRVSWHFLCHLTSAQRLIPSITLSYTSAWTVVLASQALYTPGYSPICLVRLSLWKLAPIHLLLLHLQ